MKSFTPKKIDQAQVVPRRFLKVSMRMFLMLTLLTLLGFSEIFAQTITIDGNPIDWNASNFNLFTTKVYQGDAYGNGVVDNQFTQGSKDFFPANQLVWSVSQTKAKNDIANGAAILNDLKNIRAKLNR